MAVDDGMVDDEMPEFDFCGKKLWDKRSSIAERDARRGVFSRE